jgi:CheY-like chemotaxis protein
MERVASDRGSYVVADGQRLKQVFINLISNAIKYNRPGGSVRVYVDRLSADRVRICIEDTGKGIPAESLPKLFVPFERLDAAASSVEGTGLGLALSRNLLELMGGSIEVQSTFGAGTTFEIELERTEPVAVTADELDQVGVLESKTYSKDRRLLYIEDTVANVRLIEAILKRRPSVKLLPAMLGQLGIDLAREHKPDMLLLDLHLPDIGGEEVLATFKADPKLRDIPVVILSADATKVHYDELMELGAVAYLTKPIGVEDLLNVVDRYAGDDR